ncbi:MAG: FG-GAP repeat domain-containing protein [Geodermatophilaceae bacterium]
MAVTVLLPSTDAQAAPRVSFVQKQVLANPSHDDYVLAADVDADGNLDVVSVLYEGFSVILGDGTGRFGPPKLSDIEPQLTFGAVTGDVDEDGRIDIVLADVLSKDVLLYRGDGHGGFGQGAVVTSTGGIELDLGIGDLDIDGHLDLILTQSYRRLDVLRGAGDGSFRRTDQVTLSETANGVAVEDINGDGAPDVAVGSFFPLLNPGATLVQVLLNDGTGDLSLGQPLEAGRNPASLAIGELNGDGIPDLVVANRTKTKVRSDLTRSSVAVFLGTGDGTFGPASFYPAGRRPSSVAIADFDSNGANDLAVLDNVEGFTVNILLGNGAGAFGGPQPFLTGGGFYQYVQSPVLVGRFNADRQPDIVAPSEPGYVGVGINSTHRPAG